VLRTLPTDPPRSVHAPKTHPVFIYFTRVQTMTPEECAPPEPDSTAAYHPDSNPTPVTSSEVVSTDSTFAIYEEALAETRTVVRDEAKAVLKQRIREVEQLRTTLARAEEELAKLLKKTPEEIASIRTFSFDNPEPMLKQLQCSSEQSLRRRLGMS